MDVSVIIRSKDEADRLKLTIASLCAQTVQAEIVVVNDGSCDHTGDVLSAPPPGLSLVRIDHPSALGRTAASNAGAGVASGDILLFMDGDALAAPDLVASHRQFHQNNGDRLARGDTWHLRQTRFFLDPAAATPMPDEVERVSRLSEAERRASRITAQAIRDDFASVDARAQPGIYPGAGPRRLYGIEMEALRTAPHCPTLWAAASGQNLSVARDVFLGAGGFDPAIDNNEHRELALRLSRQGVRLALTAGRSYHMTHRRRWRDPLVDRGWMKRFHHLHPQAAVALLPVLWGSLSDAPTLPEAARISSLPALAAAAERIPAGLSPDAAVAEHLRLSGALEPIPA